MKVTRANLDTLSDDLAKRLLAAMTAVEQCVKPGFTGRIVVSVVGGTATEMLSQRESNGPPKV